MIIEYFELAADFQLPPAEAILYHKQKGMKQTFNWADMLGQEHDGAFTVAKMMDNDLLDKVRTSLDYALEEGATLADFKKHLIPDLQKAGWWGKQDVIDPKTGKVVKAQLGSASRLETIFRTNLQTAYSTGHWEGIEASKDVIPYLMYDAVDDTRTRASHARWDDTVLPVTSPFWDQFMPPNGWNCRCGVIQMDGEDIEDEGLKLSKEPKVATRKWTNPRTGKSYTIPADIDPGFNRNPGKYRLASIDAAAAEKLAQMTSQQKSVMARVDVIAKQANSAARLEIQNDELLKALSIANADGALERHMERFNAKLPDVQAQKAIDAAMDDSTPYLAAAIKKVQDTKAAQGMTPAEILAKAQEQAATKQKGVAIGQYAKAKVAGKQPNAKAQAVVDALPDQEQIALAKQIDDETGETAAKAELGKIAAGEAATQTKLKQKFLKQLTANGAAQGTTAKQLLQQVEDKAQAQATKDQISSTISGYKKKVLAGKLPTPKQQEVWDSLDPETKYNHLEDIEAKQTANQPDPAPGAPLSMDTMTQIGPQKGSNPGGLYQDTETGKKYYIKQPDSEDNARNEVLTAKLYQAAGIEAPEYHLINDNGTTRIAAEFIEGLKKDRDALQKGIPGAHDGFAADAWLANWDVVGLEFDNLLVKNGKAYRIDTGGGLRYRAQGELKGNAFGNTVGEISTLIDPKTNAQAASVFKGVSADDIAAGTAKIASISDDKLERLVREYGPKGKGAQDSLLATLKARRDDLVKRYPGAMAAAKEAKKEAVEAVQNDVNSQMQQVDLAITAAIKGIAQQTNSGEVLRSKDIARVAEARELLNAFEAKQAQMLLPDDKDTVVAYYQGWMDTLEAAVTGGQGSKAGWGGGFFSPYSARLRVDESKVRYDVPVPGQAPKLTSKTSAQKIIKDALGELAAGLSFSVKHSAQSVFKRLHDGHKRAISLYTGSYYSQVNLALRNQTASKEVIRYRDLLNESLEQSVKYKGESARGITLRGKVLDSFVQGHRQAMASGKKISYRGFVSSTAGKVPAFDGNVILHINSKNGVDVAGISQHATEGEVLYQARSTYRVDKLMQDGSRTRIWLTEVDKAANDSVEFSGPSDD